MAGHSKFKNIQYRKAAQDKKRAKIFARLTRELMVAAKSGLPDPQSNARLRTAMLTARAQNMPKDNIQRAIKKAADTDLTKYQDVRYEGFAAAGVGVIVEALTDNRNRTAAELRGVFVRHAGNLGESGSVSFMFEHVGQISYAAATGSEEAMLEAAIEAGAADVASSDESHDIICDADALHDVATALGASLGEPVAVGLVWRPKTEVALAEPLAAEKVLKLLEALDECDDVQNVYANFEISDDLLGELSSE